MTDRELIRAKIEEMMAEEMAIFKQAAKDGCTEESAAPVAYTRLQMLLAYIDSMEQAPVDGRDRVLYRITTKGVGDIYVVARSFDEAAKKMVERLDASQYGFSGDRKPSSIDIIAEERLNYLHEGGQFFSDGDDSLIVAD